MKLNKEKFRKLFQPSRKDIAESLRCIAIIIETDYVGRLESGARRIVDVAGEIGELIDWQGEGYSSPTGQGYKIARPDKPEEEVSAHHSPELSEVPK